MFLAILAAFAASVFSTLAYLSDALTSRLYFAPVFAGTLAAAAWAGRPLWRRFAAEERQAASAAGFLLAFVFLLAPALPRLLPLSREWDGANHIAIARYLVDHGGHREMLATDYMLSWKGSISSYPWGFHSLVAGAARAARTGVVRVFQPLLALLLALLLVAVGQYCRRRGTMAAAAVAVAAVLNSYSDMIVHDFWAQIYGTFLVFALICFMETDAERDWLPAVPAALLAGLSVGYSLYAPVAYAGFVAHAFLKKRYSPRVIAGIVGASFLVSLLYYAPTLRQNINRLGGDGPHLLHWPLDWKSLVLLAYMPLAGAASFFFLFRRRSLYCLYPALAGAAALVFWLGEVGTIYWVSKFLALFLILAAPVLARVFDALVPRLGRAFSASTADVSAVLLAAFLTQVPFSMRYVRPAVSEHDYQLYGWMAKNHPDRAFHYVAIGYKKAWFEAMYSRPRIILPPDFRRKVGETRPKEQLLRALRAIRPGELLLIEWGSGLQAPPQLRSGRFEVLRENDARTLLRRL